MLHQEKRLIVVGTSCSGKTTLAGSIARIFEIKHIELDALFWRPNWTETPADEFKFKVAQAIQRKSWVADGNYSPVRDMIWTRAQTLIWLNYSFTKIFSQALYRTLKRALTAEKLFSGNRESIRQSFFSSDSILLWVIKTYARRKREYPLLFKELKYAHLKVIELHNQKQTDALLASYRTLSRMLNRLD
ncbi:adenylate kinase [candidate division CSSED10-310 bacterium]|uniref:Adenylate kinase n=1 Tax=candidate division CSSED10-310 bacterium TaxID=2855610 RepID=A0ABV6Z574_UNCC1